MDDANVEIISQRSITGGPAFYFNESYLKYFGVEWEFSIKYEDVAGPSQYRRGRTKDRLIVFILIYLLVLGLIIFNRDHQPHYGAEGFRWLIHSVGAFVIFLTAICTSIYFLTHKEYTVVPTKNGNILVVRDKKHDVVIERLRLERLKRLRSLSDSDPANSPQEELTKLKWLHDEGAITEYEYTYRCSQIVD